METVKELRTMLQQEKVAPRGWSRPLGYYAFQRFPSIYITRLLLPTRITPNQITLLGFIIGLLGCIFIFQFAWHYKLIGVGLLYLNVLLDKVDGEIARYKKIYSLRGIYLDYTNHLVIPPLTILSTTFGIAPISLFYPIILIIFGIAAALAMIMLRVQQNLAEIIFVKKYLHQREIFSLQETASGSIAEVRQKYPLLGTAAWLFHHIQEHFIQLIILALTIIGERVFLLDFVFHPLVSWFIVILGILLSAIVLENVLKGWISINSRVVELERKTQGQGLIN